MGETWSKQQRTANQIIDGPRPKTDPPRPPMGPQSTNEQIDSWGIEMKTWQEENKHLPNHQPVEQIVQNLKNRIAAANSNSQGAPGAAVDNTKLNSIEARVQALEVKMDKIISHFGIK